MNTLGKGRLWEERRGGVCGRGITTIHPKQSQIKMNKPMMNRVARHTIVQETTQTRVRVANNNNNNNGKMRRRHV